MNDRGCVGHGWLEPGRRTATKAMRYLYAQKTGQTQRLVATFDSHQQLLAYVRWATLQSLGERRGKFEQGSVLASYQAWQDATTPLEASDANADVPHNPSPSML